MLRLDAAVRQYRRMQRLSALAVASARGAWRLLDPHGLDATAPRLLVRLLPAVAAAQLSAATSATTYVSAALAEQNIDTQPVGRVQPDALAGVASDGRPLSTLLIVPLAAVKTLSARGVAVDRAMASGLAQLERIVVTQVIDAGRVAEGVAVAASPGAGYVRMLVPPSCSRCVVLAGRYYEWNAGFARHPVCDCIHVPATSATSRDLLTSPKAYFDSLSETEQNRIFTKAGAQAIRDGANIAQVVNARRGMRTAQVFGRDAFITLEGTTRFGQAGRRLIAEGARVQRELAERVTRISRLGPVQRQVRRQRVQIPRLMPEQIYREASSRDDAIRLLRRFGYIT